MSDLLYKFLSAENAIRVLESRQLKVSLVGELNDIYDCAPSVKPGIESDDPSGRFRSWALPEAVRRQYGLICFSRFCHSPLLWGHYASCASGIALGFDVGFLKWPDQVEVEVKYAEKRPIVDVSPLLATANDYEKVFDRFFGVKAAEWQYEREVRYVLKLSTCEARAGMYFAPFVGRALRQVILGPRANDRATYFWHYIEKNWAGLGVELYSARNHPDEYKIEPGPQRKHP